MTPYPNILAALDGSIWYLSDSKAEVLASVFGEILNGKIDAGFGVALGSTGNDIEIRDNVAVVKLHGVMGKHLSEAQSGGASTDAFRSQMEQLKNEGQIKAVVLDINSPGGSVHGVEQAAKAVRELADTMPVYAVANDVMASAAYYVASGATKIFAQPTSIIGSVGTKAMGVSFRRKMEQDGVDVVIVKSGEQKALNDSMEPLDNGRVEYLQRHVEHFGQLFYDTVSANRQNLTGEQMDKIKTGADFTAEDAIEAGLADGIMSLDEVIAAAGVEATTEMRLEAVSAAFTETQQSLMAATAEKEDLAEKVGLLQAKVDQLQADKVQSKIEEVVSQAVADKRISAAKIDTFIALGQQNGLEALTNVLEALEPAPKVPLGSDPNMMHQEAEEGEVLNQYEAEAFAAFNLNRN